MSQLSTTPADTEAAPESRRATKRSGRVAPTGGLAGDRPRRGGRSAVGRVLLWAVLIFGAIAMIIPFVWLVRSALMTNNQIFVSPPEWWPRPFAWDNFSGALTAQPFALYLLNTMIIEVVVVTGTVLTCAITAFSFARLRWRGRNVVFAILLTSVMLPYAVTLIPTFIMWSELSALNTFLPLTVPAWFAGAGGGVFNIFLMRQFFLTIPFELDEAAYIDGASPWRVFWTIIMPLSKPVVVVVVIFTFIGVWNDFLGPLLYLSDDNKFTLALGLASFQGNYTAQWGFLMAASTVIILPIIILFFVLQRYFVEGVTLTGMKN
ncbi:carbohydrate ABC transporter permease [Microlunatus soli]|uniref:Carbohydrate ABC transporter membrane protein 2, CUT1 family n=1 Tax=Microlunatus soli TaxID=630515 RepID=A0A1H1S0H4_9ACTN|nr:carbohydrate ABC transporter permease [Microlunatus soli]SDS41316.1 carbohydrate ABC transporter membrane protein 2, CUT1 family [Microlunatus soli]